MKPLLQRFVQPADHIDNLAGRFAGVVTGQEIDRFGLIAGQDRLLLIGIFALSCPCTHAPTRRSLVQVCRLAN